MTPRFAKVSEIAERFRVSVDAVYLWIRQGKIPADCVIGIAGTVRVDQEQFEQRLRSGALYHPRGRKAPANEQVLGTSRASADDSITTVKSGPRTEHRWTGESAEVEPRHPFSPAMVKATR
jgi:excisionase family DNA binding protein